MSLVSCSAKNFSNYLAYLYNLLSPIYWSITKASSYWLLKKNKHLKDQGSGRSVFIVGNAPSFNKLDFAKMSKIGDIFICNKAILHLESSVEPKAYFCIDGKIDFGDWDPSMIHAFIADHPKASVFLNAKLSSRFINKFRFYSNIYWLMPTMVINEHSYFKHINLSSNIYGFNVVKVMIQAAIYMKYDYIYLCGVENNGFAYEILNVNSHFYDGSNEIKNPLSDIWEVAWAFSGWKGLAGVSQNLFNTDSKAFLPWLKYKSLDIWK